jgi:two-component system NtrC family sensor kinase
MPENEPQSARPPRAPSSLEKEETRLWRIVLFFMVLLATAVAALSWERLKEFPYTLVAIPIGLVALAILFATFVYGRRKEVADLKLLLKDLEGRVGIAPSEEQIDQLNQVIARSQRSFKELIDSFDDVAFAISLDGSLRTVNRRMTEVLGHTYSEVVGHKLDEFLDEPQRDRVEPALARFLDKPHWSGVVTVRLKGSTRPLYFDCVVNGIVKAGEVVGASTLARDITEEREKEKRFTELFETLQEGVYFSNSEGKLLDVNPALVQMLGYGSKDELLALTPEDLNFDRSQKPVLGMGTQEKHGLRTREITLRRKDGTATVCMDSARAVWDDAGQVLRYQGTLVDVTERRRMEQQIRQQEEFQRRMLESFPDLILVIDLEERYKFVSARIGDLLGYRPEDLLGRKLDDVENSSPELAALYRNVASGTQLFGAAEYAAKHRDGTMRTMRAAASQLFGADDKPSGVVVSVRDITVEKKLEQQVVQSERLAAMGQMIGGFAHELNNPLTSILGVSELLQEGETTETSRKQLTMLHQQARRAAEIVQNLMYFSRPPAPGKSRVDIGELIDRTLHLQAYSLRKANITVDFTRDQKLPPVVGEPRQLMQVFLNLILNAEQAMRENKERGSLRIRAGQHEQCVWATFQDDGPGISPEILPHIFDPFYTTKRPGRGTGLGLSICKAVLKEHGGNVEANSTPGGALFTVMLPIATKEESGAASSTTPE